MKLKKIFVRAGLMLFCIYVGCYVILSLAGHQTPQGAGSNGVKYTVWAPAGFVVDGQWNWPLIYLFYPLWIADVRCWHTERG